MEPSTRKFDQNLEIAKQWISTTLPYQSMECENYNQKLSDSISALQKLKTHVEDETGKLDIAVKLCECKLKSIKDNFLIKNEALLEALNFTEEAEKIFENHMQVFKMDIRENSSNELAGLVDECAFKIGILEREKRKFINATEKERKDIVSSSYYLLYLNEAKSKLRSISTVFKKEEASVDVKYNKIEKAVINKANNLKENLQNTLNSKISEQSFKVTQPDHQISKIDPQIDEKQLVDTFLDHFSNKFEINRKYRSLQVEFETLAKEVKNCTEKQKILLTQRETMQAIREGDLEDLPAEPTSATVFTVGASHITVNSLGLECSIDLEEIEFIDHTTSIADKCLVSFGDQLFTNFGNGFMMNTLVEGRACTYLFCLTEFQNSLRAFAHVFDCHKSIVDQKCVFVSDWNSFVVCAKGNVFEFKLSELEWRVKYKHHELLGLSGVSLMGGVESGKDFLMVLGGVREETDFQAGVARIVSSPSSKVYSIISNKLYSSQMFPILETESLVYWWRVSDSLIQALTQDKEGKTQSYTISNLTSQFPVIKESGSIYSGKPIMDIVDTKDGKISVIRTNRRVTILNRK